MIEIIIKKYLDEHLTVSSFLEKVEDMPDSYVLFEKQEVVSSIIFQHQHLLFKAMHHRCMKPQNLMKS